MRSFLTLCAVLATALLWAATGHAQIVLNAGHVTSVNTDQGQAAEAFAARVAELTNGEIEIRVFPDGQLGKSDPDQLENVISGAQGFFITGMEWYKAWDDRFGILSTPFVFRDREHLKSFLRSELFADMAQTLADRGLRFVPKDFNWIRQGDRGILARKPIFTPDDLEGLRLRMFQSEMPIKSWTALGASLHVMPWADVYTAFATGQVDAVTAAFTFPYTAKHVEFAKYFTNLKEYFQPIAPVIGVSTWNSLSPEHQAALQQAAEDAGEAFVSASAGFVTTFRRSGIDDYGVSFIEVPLKPWHDKMAPVLEQFEADGILPAGLVAQVKAIQ